MRENGMTISELAKLMQVSVHQIRYFEEKGVLLPAYISENQYRMYGLDEVYRLAHILLLRRLGISVQSIKDCLGDFTPDQVASLLRQGMADTEEEIRRLQELNQFIHKVIQEYAEFSEEGLVDERRIERGPTEVEYAKEKQSDEQQTTITSQDVSLEVIGKDSVGICMSNQQEYRIKHLQPLSLEKWFELEPKQGLHAELLKEQRLPSLFEVDIHYLWDESGTITLYSEMKDDQEGSDLLLPEGAYLVSRCQIREEQEIDERIEQLYEYASRQEYVVAGPLVVIEKSYLSLFHSDKLHYELRIRLDDLDSNDVHIKVTAQGEESSEPSYD